MLDDNLIVGVTLAGYEVSPNTIDNLISVARAQVATIKKSGFNFEDRFDLIFAEISKNYSCLREGSYLWKTQRPWSGILSG